MIVAPVMEKTASERSAWNKRCGPADPKLRALVFLSWIAAPDPSLTKNEAIIQYLDGEGGVEDYVSPAGICNTEAPQAALYHLLAESNGPR